MTDLALGQKLSDAAREYANATIAAFRIPGGVHPPTVVAACARMAGTYLFRSFGLDLPGVLPGQAGLSVEANEQAPMLLQTAAGILATLGVTIASAPTTPLEGEKTRPRHEFLATQRLLEPVFAAIQRQFGLTMRQGAQATSIATAIPSLCRALGAECWVWCGGPRIHRGVQDSPRPSDAPRRSGVMCCQCSRT